MHMQIGSKKGVAGCQDEAVSQSKHALRNVAMLEVAHICKTCSRLSTGNSSKVAIKGKLVVKAEKPQSSKQPIRQVSKCNSLH